MHLSTKTKREHVPIEGFCGRQRPAREGWGGRKKQGEGVRLRGEGESEHALTAFCISLDSSLHLSHVRTRKYRARRIPRQTRPSTPFQISRPRRRTRPTTTPFDPKRTHGSAYPRYQAWRPWNHSKTRSRCFTRLRRNRLARRRGKSPIKSKSSRKILSQWSIPGPQLISPPKRSLFPQRQNRP